MLKEFKHFGVVNCKMDPWCLGWSTDKKLIYYPRSFSGMHSGAAVNVTGHVYAPPTDKDKPEHGNSDVFNLGIFAMMVLKPENKFFNNDLQQFDFVTLSQSMAKKEDLFGLENNQAFTDDLNDFVRDMLIYDNEDRPSVCRLR